MSRQEAYQLDGLVYPVEIVLGPSWWHKHAGRRIQSLRCSKRRIRPIAGHPKTWIHGGR